MKKVILLSIILFSPLYSQFFLDAKSFPKKEEAVYLIRTPKSVFTNKRISFISNERLYEYSYTRGGHASKTVLRFDASFDSYIFKRSNETIFSIHHNRENKEIISKNHIKSQIDDKYARGNEILSENLFMAMRMYDFDSKNTVEFRMYNSHHNYVAKAEVHYVDLEEIKTEEGESVKAHHISMRLTGLAGLFVGMHYHFWYSHDLPYRLLRYIGGGQKGNKGKILVGLISYKTNN